MAPPDAYNGLHAISIKFNSILGVHQYDTRQQFPFWNSLIWQITAQDSTLNYLIISENGDHCFEKFLHNESC
jgi:hypothetical protein